MNLFSDAKIQLSRLIADAYDACVAAGELPAGAPAGVSEIPKEQSHGDLASNFALAASKILKTPPRAAAEKIISRLNLDGSYFKSAEVAGPGFINLRYSDKWYGAAAEAVETLGVRYGRVNDGAGKRVMVEFVSANPTGPMTVGNARGGVLGDTLAAVLDAAGYDVTREFYLNDAGNQVDVLGQSLEARYLQELGHDVPFPEDGYHGDYVTEFAKAYIAENGDSLADKPGPERRAALAAWALPQNVAVMRRDLERYGIRFDVWFAESSLHESGYIAETVELLRARGATYEKDGALWLRGADFGLEKDEVLIKANGFYTYYCADIAYHRDKFERRGFDAVVDVLGADHHGHTLRFKAGMAALGIDPERLRFVLMQLVRLTRDGEVVRMSKRTGKAITLADLLDEIDRDACRFFFNLRQPDTHLEFDMGLAVRSDSENPVYYVKYAHARICSLLSLLESDGFAPGRADVSLLTHEAERELLRHIAMLPEEVRAAAREYEPSRINRYLIELAARFHRFYNACRIREAEPDVRAARMGLCALTGQVLRNGLALLGIGAPEKM